MAYEDETLDIHDAARQLGVHAQTVRRLARQNRIPAYKVGKVWRFSRGALRRWADAHHERVRGASILVVDDERITHDLTRRILEPEGYRVSPAFGGAEALALMRRETPDVVLLDLRMPDMPGPDVLKEIRRAHGALPVIIITGYPDGELMHEALRYSPVMMLAKPVTPEQLLESVRLVLGEGREVGVRSRAAERS